MTTPLHRDIAAIAKNDPAIHLSELVLINLITNRLDEALRTFVGFYRKYPDVGPIVQIGLKSCNYSRATANWRMYLPPRGTQPGAFSIRSTASFAAVFAVTKVDDTSIELFTVRLTVREVNAAGLVSNGKISIKDPVVSFETHRDEDPNYEDNLEESGLTDENVKRLEGLVEGAVVPISFTNIFRGARDIDLGSLFPMISFQDPPDLVPLQGGLLLVARLGAQLNEAARCPCAAQSPPITAKPGKPTPNPDPATGGTLPIDITIPPPARQPTENTLNGALSLYLPEPTIQSMTGGPYPSVTGYVDDNGFIGYSVDYSVAFLSSALSFSDPRAMLVLKVEFYINAHGEVNVDLPCVGRSPIGRVWVTNRNNPHRSYFEIGVSPKILPGGKLVLEQQLLHVFVSFVEVDVVTIASWLLGYLFAYGGIYGFLIDMILAREIGFKLPFKLEDAVRDVMGKFNWTIFDLSKFDLNVVDRTNHVVRPAASRTNDSVLLGFALTPE